MNKENIISNFAAGIGSLVVAGISLHFVSEAYSVLVGFFAGIGHGFLVPVAKRIIFKGE